MNPLLLLAPETAHKFALWGLRHGLGPKQDIAGPQLRSTLFGRELRNPIGLSAGAEKQAEALAGWADMGFGMVEAGTVTPSARSGNPSPRIWRVGGNAVVNWMGLPGDGLAPFVANLRAFSEQPQRKQLMLGASIASPDGSDSDFAALAEACSPWVDYLTLNASCPNVAHCGAADPAATARAQISEAVSGANGTPVLLKLGPTLDSDSLKVMVDAAMQAGAAGIVATNTLPFSEQALAPGLSVDWPQRENQPVGGYSGPALLDISTWMVAQCREHLGPDIPIIGVGGVQSGADACRLMDAGANAIQLYTGLIYKGAGLLKDIAQTLQHRS